ncbi:sensor histidine kinase [Anaerophilus nitritogenes]|uniref:sensor histidine kinase n=1 Tax=Anaerophilus nitritogenes TaxID=2498136 RepID=UPI001FAA0F9A|nr:ATP-binding protein [Anaerophilus nitritogenes]
MLINSFVSEVIRFNSVYEKKMHLISQGKIMSSYVSNYQTGRISNDEIISLMDGYSKELGVRILIVSKDRKVLYDTSKTSMDTKISNWEIEESLKGKSVAKEYSSKERSIYIAIPILFENEVYGSIFISSSLEDVYKSIRDMKRRYFYLSLLCLSITGFISFLLAHVIATPIERLTKSINKMYQGDLEQRVELRGHDELTDMARAFNLMSTKLFQVDKQRKEFVGNVSHELRTPLSAIKLLSQSLLHEDIIEPNTYKEFLKDIVSEVDRLNKIIESLLSLVDIDKEKLEVEYQLTYINDLIEKLICTLKPLANEKNIYISFIHFEKIQIKIDPIKMQQALTNILSNAIKYTHKEGQIKVLLYEEEQEVVIKIKDNGIGIPKNSLPYIFERFYRVDKARSRQTGGTGLGLSISKQIIELHQGKIEVSSEEHKGTTFKIQLPCNI